MSDDPRGRAEQYLREWEIAFQRGAHITDDALLVRDLLAALTAERTAREQAEQKCDELQAHQERTTRAWGKAEERVYRLQTQVAKLQARIAKYATDIYNMQTRAEQAEQQRDRARTLLEAMGHGDQCRKVYESRCRECTCGYDKAFAALSLQDTHEELKP
jgi:chromosome segregation ATPase